MGSEGMIWDSRLEMSERTQATGRFGCKLSLEDRDCGVDSP
jgi:hypothetical protein